MSGHISRYRTMRLRRAKRYSADLVQALQNGRKAWVHSRWYPMVTPYGAHAFLTSSAQESVVGEVYNMPADPGWLAALDSCGGCDPEEEPDSEDLWRNQRFCFDQA